MTVDAVRYNGTIHDFVLLNALRHVPSTEAAIEQINEGLRQHLELVNALVGAESTRRRIMPPRRRTASIGWRG